MEIVSRNRFESRVYRDLAEGFGRRTVTAMIANRPLWAVEFFARMAAHFALQAVSRG